MNPGPETPDPAAAGPGPRPGGAGDPARPDQVRVLHIITGLAAGGAEEQLRLLLPRLAGHGVASEVAVFYQAGSVAQALRADGIPVTDLRSPGFWDRRAAARLTALVRAGGYDLVHTHLFRAGLHGRIAARRAGVRTLVHTEHSLNPVLIEGRRRNPAIDRLYRWAERRGTLTVAVSAVAAELAALGVGADRIRVLPNGIAPAELAFDRKERAGFRAEYGLAAEDFVVLCLGRLAAAKRLDLAIEALAAIDPGGRANLRLVFVGQGEEQAALTALAEQRLPGRAVFTGELPGNRLSAALSAADLLLSPSPEETFGLAVLSAAAVGLPVAFASCPALTELGLAGPTPADPEQAAADPDPNDPRAGEPAEAVPGFPAVQWTGPAAASLSRAVERALAARRDPDPAERQADPDLAGALRGYGVESIAGRLAQLYRELLGPSPDGPAAPENDLISQARRVGVHHV